MFRNILPVVLSSCVTKIPPDVVDASVFSEKLQRWGH